MRVFVESLVFPRNLCTSEHGLDFASAHVAIDWVERKLNKEVNRRGGYKGFEIRWRGDDLDPITYTRKDLMNWLKRDGKVCLQLFEPSIKCLGIIVHITERKRALADAAEIAREWQRYSQKLADATGKKVIGGDLAGRTYVATPKKRKVKHGTS